MNYKNKFFGIASLSIVALALLLVSFSSAQEVQEVQLEVKSDIIVIVNIDNPVSHLSIVDLKRIFKGKRKVWNSGPIVTLWLPSSGSESMQALLAKVFDYEGEDDLNKFYLIAIFQQKFSDIPMSVKGDRDAVKEIALDKGGIALVDASKVSSFDGVKIIRVDGLSSSGF